jgi:hypothetical protein
MKVPMSEQLISWIEHLCRVPEGVHKGGRIALTVEQKQLLRLLFDGPQLKHTVEGMLAPCLALAAVCGPSMGDPRLSFATSDEEMWSVASSELRALLSRDGQGRINYSGSALLTT